MPLFFLYLSLNRYLIMKIILAAEPNTVDKIQKKIINQELDETESDKKSLSLGSLKTYISGVENKLKAIRSNLKLFEAFKTVHYVDEKTVEVQCYQSPMTYAGILLILSTLNKELSTQINKRDNPTNNYSIFFKDAINEFKKNLNKDLQYYLHKATEDNYRIKKLIPNVIFESGSYQSSSHYLHSLSETIDSYNESKHFLFESVSNNKNINKIAELVISTYENCLKEIFSHQKYTIVAVNRYNSAKENDFRSLEKGDNYYNTTDRSLDISDQDDLQKIKNHALINKFIEKNTNLNEEQVRTIRHQLHGEIINSVAKLIQSPLAYVVEPLFELISSSSFPLRAKTIDFVLESSFFYKFKKLTEEQIEFIFKYTSNYVIDCFNKPFIKELSNLPVSTFEEYKQSVQKINNFIINTGNVISFFKNGVPKKLDDEPELDFKSIVGMMNVVSKRYTKWFPDISPDLTNKFCQDAAKVINKYYLNNKTSIGEMIVTSFLMKMMEIKFNLFKVYLKYCLCGKDVNYLSKELTPYINLTLDLGNGNITSENNRDKFQLLVDFSRYYLNSKISETKVDAFFNNLDEYAQIIHSTASLEIKSISNLLIATNVKIDSQAKKQFIQFWGNERLNPFETMQPSTLEERLGFLKISSKEFSDQYQYYLRLFKDMKIVSGNDTKFVHFFKTCSLLSSMDSYQEYIELKKPKDEKLFNLNYTTDNYSFRVLDDTSIEYFSVGIDTNCCQFLGGYGHDAAVDSFINPVASVLILDDKDGNILAQSYFHYVPEDNGFILDNVETNENNIKKANIDINSCYAELGKYLKKKYDIKYFRCGLEYNKLNSRRFARGSDKQDNRHFETDKYSDYSPKHFLDLLNSNNSSAKQRSKKKPVNENVSRTPEAQARVDERKNYLEYKKNKDQSNFSQKLPLQQVSAGTILKMLQKYGIT